MLFFSFSQDKEHLRKINLTLIDEENETLDSIEFKPKSYPFLNYELKKKLPTHIQFIHGDFESEDLFMEANFMPFQLDTIKRVTVPENLSEIYSIKF
jgi:hypothetical protein